MTSHRIESIDFLRGLVMIIMALDHVRDYFRKDFDHARLKETKWLLANVDLHHMYEKYGFTAAKNPERFMGKQGWVGFEEYEF